MQLTWNLRSAFTVRFQNVSFTGHATTGLCEARLELMLPDAAYASSAFKQANQRPVFVAFPFSFVGKEDIEK